MSYSQQNVADSSSLGADFSKAEFTRLNYNLDSGIPVKNPVIDYLEKFADINSWLLLSINDNIELKSLKDSEHLFVDDFLTKAHNPNLLFDQIRRKIPFNSYFAFTTITAENIKGRIQNEFTFSSFIVYYPIYFFFRRFLPKLKGFRKICRLLSIPVDMSKAEIIGRLIYKGFKIVDIVDTGIETTIVTQINVFENPSASKSQPCEGFLFKMNRLGKGGKTITIYKFRSMHPYAEYLQDYIHKMNGLDTGGKFKNDFRVSTGGRILRKYWIDELPMLFNLLRGDIKLIGVRPISEHYLSLYPKDVQSLRNGYKPGLLPPFYADMPKTFEEIVASEMNYFKQYDQAPLKTDLVYFLRIVKNIVIHKARSK
ncbi:hypothetical protein GCM10028805_60910 [Spirosoma harenae]